MVAKLTTSASAFCWAISCCFAAFSAAFFSFSAAFALFLSSLLDGPASPDLLDVNKIDNYVNKNLLF